MSGLAPVDIDPAPSTSPRMSGISLGLARIHRLLALLRSPHCATPVVHISGTNGKGSVSAYLSSILSHGQLAVGRFNSPHLVDEWDCVHLHGRPVEPRRFYDAKAEIETLSEREGVGATSFEVLTATAFTLFARAQPPLNVAVVEVGMGGSEDATNVVPADRTLLSIVTSVDLDHQKFLGDTVGEIAQVKAAIAREGGDVVLSVQTHPEARTAVLKVAADRGATVWEAGEAAPLDEAATGSASVPPPPPSVNIPFAPVAAHPARAGIPATLSAGTLRTRLPLPGAYQLSNAATAVLAGHLLRSLPRTVALVPKLATCITDDSMRTGIETTRWPGRLSWLSLPASIGAGRSQPVPEPPKWTQEPGEPLTPARTRLVLLDGAHNPSSARLLAGYLSSLSPSLRPHGLVFGLSAPRDPEDVVRPLLDALTMPGDVAPDGQGAYPRKVRIVCTAFSPPAGMGWVRATPPGVLAQAVRRLVAVQREKATAAAAAAVEVEVLEAEDVEAALRLLDTSDAESEPLPPFVVAGSLYLAADVLRLERRLTGRDVNEDPIVTSTG